MNQPSRIAITAVIHVGQLLATALVITIACESLGWFLCWQDARKHG